MANKILWKSEEKFSDFPETSYFIKGNLATSEGSCSVFLLHGRILKWQNKCESSDKYLIQSWFSVWYTNQRFRHKLIMKKKGGDSNN